MLLKLKSVVILTIWVDFGATFNVDVDHPLELKTLGRKPQRFGHAVALGSKNTAYVGAPLYDKSGTLFQCEFDLDRDNSRSYCNPVSSKYYVI